MTRGFDYMTGEQRAGIDHEDLVIAHALTKHANIITAEQEDTASGSGIIHFPPPPKQDDNDDTPASLAADFAKNTIDKSTDLRRRPLEKLNENVHAVKHSYQKLAAAKDPVSIQRTKAVHEKALKSLHTETGIELKRQKLADKKYLRLNPHSKKLANELQNKRHGWEIFDEKNMAEVERMSKGLGILGRSFIYFDVLKLGKDVILSYLEGGDWGKVLLKGAGEIVLDVGMAYLAGAVIGLFFTPVGWVGLIVVGLISATAVGLANLGYDRLL